jgi:hypothetical protein
MKNANFEKNNTIELSKSPAIQGYTPITMFDSEIC